MFSLRSKHGTRRSFRLFAVPSFIEGVGRILDFYGLLNTYNKNSSGAEADCRAMQSDWKAVGGDLWVALDRYKHGKARAKQTLWKANMKGVSHAQ